MVVSANLSRSQPTYDSAAESEPSFNKANVTQLLKQLLGIFTVGAYAFVVTWILGKIVDVTMGLRVGQVEETVGLDISQRGERAYGGLLR